MKREVIRTSDGSTTIHLPDWDESYHSKHGAIQEAYHVFIQNGLSLFAGKPVSILEIGFGTGLNALITYLESKKSGQQVHYTGVEAYPVESSEVLQMNYASNLGDDSLTGIFEQMHQSAWNMALPLSSIFTLTKQHKFFHEIDDVSKYDLIYFDAFGYRVQPELWSEEIFGKMYAALNQNGVLVTYAARSPIKRAMQESGFQVQKLAGPPGKREMFRAIKGDLIKL